MNLIQILEQEEMARLARKIPAFAPGDTVVVSNTALLRTGMPVKLASGASGADQN